MNMNKTCASITSALIFVSATGVALAATTTADLTKKKASQVTCEDFIGLDESFQPTVIAWAAGFQKGQDKPDDAVLDIDGIARIMPVLVEACKADPTASFWDKAKAELKKAM